MVVVETANLIRSSDNVLLDVLVPTFRRPESATRAINSVITAEDNRARVICHSNGPESKLTHYGNLGPEVVYDYFEENLGPEANIAWLYAASTAKFCMLLSDEDALLTASLPKFLDYLSNLDNDCNVVSCSVFNEVTESFEYRVTQDPDEFASGGLDKLRLNLAGFTNLTSSSYMSGYVYRNSALRSLNAYSLIDVASPHCRNCYSQIDIAQQLLTQGTARTYSPKFVLKGAAIETGGHAFCHRSSGYIPVNNNLDLNPDVYGPYARTSQYLYREKLLCGLGANFHGTSYMIADAKLYAFFFQVLLNSPQVVVLTDNSSVQSEAERAIRDAIKCNFFSGSITANIFIEAITGPKELMLEMLGHMTAVHSATFSLSGVSRQYIAD
jgi:glycosyltransferase involved in cell wall biosynthesis